PLSVGQFNKLIGKDVIVAHQLLKNEIPQHEYWLVTNNQFQNQQPAEFAQWMQWNSGSKQTENGQITFYYAQLGPLKNEIPKPSPQHELSGKTKTLSVSMDYPVPIKTLVYTMVHFE